MVQPDTDASCFELGGDLLRRMSIPAVVAQEDPRLRCRGTWRTLLRRSSLASIGRYSFDPLFMLHG
ncbi:MAG: hypothetical protein MI919_26320, partial [Holophagales bacterium]|nr:hypothetical protein [Holophagales bacterium]